MAPALSGLPLPRIFVSNTANRLAARLFVPSCAGWSPVGEQPDMSLAEIKGVLAKEKVKVAQSSIFRFLDHL
jgi:hypothetical protein